MALKGAIFNSLNQGFIIGKEKMLAITKNYPLNKPNSTYFDIRRLFKYYPKNVLYVIYGTGGGGKTTSIVIFLKNLYKKQIKAIEEKEWTRLELLNGSIKIENKFIWLNRTDIEIKGKKNGVFARNGWVAQGSQNEIQVPIEIKIKGEKKDKKNIYYATVGKYEAINNSSKIRGGENYDEYAYVIWDEFMDEVEKYLPNEMKKVKSILTTVIRSKKGTKWIFLSNTVSKDNAVFNKFKFNPDWLEKGQQLYFPEMKRLFVYLGVSGGLEKEYKGSDLITVLGKDDEYIRYRFGGDFVNDDDEMIERELDPNYPIKPSYNIVYLENLIGVFRYKNGLYFSESRQQAGAKIYPLTKADATVIGRNFVNVDGFANHWLNLIRTRKVYFENDIVKQLILTFVSKNADIRMRSSKK